MLERRRPRVLRGLLVKLAQLVQVLLVLLGQVATSLDQRVRPVLPDRLVLLPLLPGQLEPLLPVIPDQLVRRRLLGQPAQLGIPGPVPDPLVQLARLGILDILALPDLMGISDQLGILDILARPQL